MTIYNRNLLISNFWNDLYAAIPVWARDYRQGLENILDNIQINPRESQPVKKMDLGPGNWDRSLKINQKHFSCLASILSYGRDFRIFSRVLRARRGSLFEYPWGIMIAWLLEFDCSYISASKFRLLAFPLHTMGYLAFFSAYPYDSFWASFRLTLGVIQILWLLEDNTDYVLGQCSATNARCWLTSRAFVTLFSGENR